MLKIAFAAMAFSLCADVRDYDRDPGMRDIERDRCERRLTQCQGNDSLLCSRARQTCEELNAAQTHQPQDH